MSLKQAVTFGIVFGLVAAVMVWYLERFELNRLHGEINDYLSKRDEFTEYLKLRENGANN